MNQTREPESLYDRGWPPSTVGVFGVIVAAVIVLALVLLVALPAFAQAYDPPANMSSGDIANSKQRPILPAEEQTLGQAVSTTTVNALGTAAQNADVAYSGNVVQNLRIVNTHASNFLCYRTVNRAAAGTSCDTLCTGLAAGTLTCTGSGAADGTLITAGATFITAISGLSCPCLEASAAGTNVNATRVFRTPQ